MDVDEEDANQSEIAVLERKSAKIKMLVDSPMHIHSRTRDARIKVHFETD